jgi:hypothetical protein
VARFDGPAPSNYCPLAQIRFYLNDNPDKVLTSDELEYISSKLEFGHDNRAGMNGSLHRISRVINRMDRATGVTMRIGRCMPGISELIKDLIQVSVPRGSLFGKAKGSILYCFSHFVVCKESTFGSQTKIFTCGAQKP